ncbi:hypothetical protein SpCBS45565_g02300 [Spizellomyces sp. 'palustris']|nr:hypothetical protein SpCBS45565_g02300 [Spizellomyces sp. 'palustris']
MSHLSLKITVVGMGLTKTLQFSGDMSVHEVCREIREKFGEGAGGSDHGLLWPDQGKWLQASKILDFYDLNSGDALEYRKKHRALKVKTMDDSVKTVIIDESLPVQQLVEIICEKIGIQNPEEYSILPEMAPAEAGTKEGGKDAGKSAPTKIKGGREMLAGDQSRWLHPDKTIREQGLTDEDTVLLKKKFFFTDQNIDRNDPVQLNLLYNQAREMIISGKHPCTAEEACQFGAIQMQVQHGNHEPDKHKPGFIKVRDFVPPEYQKNKDVEKRIYVEHSKLQGLGELNAKFRYVQLSRSLKTYGITFFLVEDETAKKKKNAQMLLGVTKQSVVKLDPITKEIVREWRLTQLRRWAASPNSFTMDFGDYADAYFSVKTTEGEQISQLIAGYIDIIIKKRKEAEKVVEIDEEEQATMEEFVTPSRATNVGVVSSGARTAVETKLSVPPMTADGMRPGWGRTGTNVYTAQYGGAAGGFVPQMAEITGAQQTLMQSISNGFAMVNNAAADMMVAANLPPLGNDAAAIQWKQHTVDVNAEAVASQITSNLAAAGSLINTATGYVEEMDYEVIGANISTMTANLSQLAQGIKLLAGLQESMDDQERLLAAGRGLAKAAAKLLEAAQPICMGQTNREDFFVSSKAVAAASAELLGLMGRLDISEDGQNELIDAAKHVSKAAMDLVSSARPLAAAVKDSTAQQVIIAEAKRIGEAAPALMACTSTVCPAITNAQCFDQLVESAMLMRDGIEQLVELSDSSSNPKLQTQLKEHAQKVEELIAKLIEKAKRGGDNFVSDPIDMQHDSVITSIDQMMETMDSVDGIVNGARDLTLISMQYVNMLKGLGLDVNDFDERNRLLNAARTLGDVTSKMVAAAKDAARNLNDPTSRGRLEESILALREATNTAAGPQLRGKAFQKLIKAAKDTVASSNQLISVSRTVAQSNRNQASQLQLNQAAKRVTEMIPSLASALKTSANEPENLVAQMKLIEAAKKFITPGNSLVASAKVAAPTTADVAAQGSLLSSVKQCADDIRDLEKAFALAEEASAGLELESALYSLKAYHDELMAASSNPDVLVPLDGYSVETSQMELLGAVKSLQHTITQVLGAVQQGNEKITGTAATDAVAALQALSFAALALSAAESDLVLRRDLLGAANGVANSLSSLLTRTKDALEDPTTRSEFEALAAQTSNAIESLTGYLPGQKELDKTIFGIRGRLAAIDNQGLSTGVPAGGSFQTAQTKLQTAATGLSVAANALVSASRGSPIELQQNATAFMVAFYKLGDASGTYAAATQDQAVAGRLLQLLHDLGGSCERMLGFTKTSATDPSNSILRNQLMNATKGVGDSINQLLEVCSAAAPGHKECNNALQALNVALSKLDAVNDATVNQDTYSETVGKSSAGSKTLAAALNSLAANVRSGNVTKVASDATEVANAILTITDGNVRAAYLVGTADESSIAAIPPVVDQNVFSQAGSDIKEACRKLVDRNNTQQQILETAGLIAKQTGKLCTECKTAGEHSGVTPTAKHHFLHAAKDLANKTSALVAAIKQLALNPCEYARAECQETAQPLTDAVDRLVAFAMSPEFSGTEAKVGTAAAAAQRPILDGTQSLITCAQDLVGTMKLICSNPKDQASQQLLQAQSRDLTESTQSALQTVTGAAPGQRECEGALQKLSESVASVDSAIVEATVNNLAPHQGTISTSALVDNVRALASLGDVVAKAAKEDSARLGASVGEMPTSYARAATAAVALASNMMDIQEQMKLLEQVKALGDAMNAFVYAAKNNGGNAKNAAGVQKVDEEKAKFRAVVTKLVTTLEGSRDESGEFTKAFEQIEEVVATLESRIPETVKQAYNLFEEELEGLGKQIVGAVGDVISKAKTPDQFRKAATQLAGLYEDICTKGGGAIRATNDAKVKQGIQDSLRSLGASKIKLIESIRHASGKSAADNVSRSKLSSSAREVSGAVANLMTVTKEGSKGLLQCKAAVTHINDTVAELEGTLIFAQAGQLDPVDTKENFARHKDSLLGAARALTEQVKVFISAVTGTQDELGAVSTAAIGALDVLKNEARLAAISITSADKHMQQQLLGAAKKVSECLQVLISTATNACGRSPDDPLMSQFAETVKAEFQAMGELVRATKVLGDETKRGTRAFDGAMAEIEQAMVVLESSEPAQGTALPDEVAGSAKLLATAAASLVSASTGKQDELVAAANAIKKQMEDLVRAAKAATEKAPPEQKALMVDAVKKAGAAVKGLIGGIKLQQENNTPQNKANVQGAAKEVALSVNAVVNAAGALIPGGYVDPNDPNVIAERELLAAAASIEAAARKLANLVPAERPRTANEDLNFEEQILDATKSIAAATAALVRSATGAQREIVARGRTGPKEESMYFSDGTWSDGLVSAAKMVAGATSDLCEAANQAVKGKIERERVIVAAKAVSASTAQLLAAATARADPNSQAQIRLRAAGKAVTGATDNLVRAAQENMAFDDADQFSSIMSAAGKVGGAMQTRVAEMEAQVAILKMEKELERARLKLASVRKGKYDAAKKDAPAGDAGTAATKLAARNKGQAQ